MGVPEAVATGKSGLGRVAQERGEFVAATEYLTDAHEVAREIGNRPLKMEIEGLSGLVAMDAGDLERAVEWYDVAIETAATLGDYDIALVSSSFAVEVCAELGDDKRAVKYCRQALNLLDEADDALEDIHDLDRDWFREFEARLGGRSDG
jgi:tetratricopeptide (TPR) repeat protein